MELQKKRASRSWNDPLLESYHPNIGKIPQKLRDEVHKRSGGKCEFPFCGERATEINHIAHRRRVPHLNNLMDS